MAGGKKTLLATAALAVAGCTADDGKLNVRAIADPLSAAAKRGSPMIVEGRAALALNNVGTALEAFRKVLREEPDSVEALAGVAACYERMGRYDLARVNYEAALAVAPNNPLLLNTFAASLQKQGKIVEALALRAEAERAEASEVAATVRSAQAELATENVAAVAAAVHVPAPVRVAEQKVAPPAIPPSRVASAPAQPTVTAAKPAIAAVAKPTRPAVVQIAKEASQPQVIHRETIGNTSWTIEAPVKEVAQAQRVSPPAPIAAIEAAAPPPPPVAVQPAPAPAPVPVAPAPVKDAVAPVEPVKPRAPAPFPSARAKAVALHQPEMPSLQPRLQRLSMGEVALLTRDAPAWRTEVVAQTRHSVTARFVPLQSASREVPRFVPLREVMAANRPNFRILNAARLQGLAARTRATLLDRGWRKIAIGDAGQVRAKSVVLYPAGRQVLGKRLAAQFGFTAMMSRQGSEVLVLLGRDAASQTVRRARA